MNGIAAPWVPFTWMRAVDAAVSADTGALCIKRLYSCLYTRKPPVPWCTFTCNKTADDYARCLKHKRAMVRPGKKETDPELRPIKDIRELLQDSPQF